MAARLDPTISMLKVGISVIISSILGALAGYWGGWLDAVLDRILDTILAFPLFVPAMGSSPPSATRWKTSSTPPRSSTSPFYARVVRAEVNIRREAGFTPAARLSDNEQIRTLAVYILPNAPPPMMVQVTLDMGWAILDAAELSFVGPDVRPPTPEWGIMVAESANYIISGQ